MKRSGFRWELRPNGTVDQLSRRSTLENYLSRGRLARREIALIPVFGLDVAHAAAEGLPTIGAAACDS